MTKRRSERGDTIIEVLLAFTVFSLVSVGAMAIMNQGTNAAERSLEVTLVKEQIDAQAEALRAAQQAYFSVMSDPNPANTAKTTWSTITGYSVPSPANNVSGGSCATSLSNAFVMNPRTAAVETMAITTMDKANTPPYSQVQFDSSGNLRGIYGIWIERLNSTTGTPPYYDFRIRACWFAPGVNVPMELQTIVRLYGQ